MTFIPEMAVIQQTIYVGQNLLIYAYTNLFLHTTLYYFLPFKPFVFVVTIKLQQKPRNHFKLHPWKSFMKPAIYLLSALSLLPVYGCNQQEVLPQKPVQVAESRPACGYYSEYVDVCARGIYNILIIRIDREDLGLLEEEMTRFNKRDDVITALRTIEVMMGRTPLPPAEKEHLKNLMSLIEKGR